MGDLDAKSLLLENSKLKIQQNELSIVLGEEKEMVKYLHGVIKSYEQLLRSSSKSKSTSRSIVLKRNLSDLEIDTNFTATRDREKDSSKESVASNSIIRTTQPMRGGRTGLNKTNRKTTLLSRSEENPVLKGNGEDDMERFSSYQEVSQSLAVNENCSKATDDLYLENLEESASSDEDSVEENIGPWSRMNDHKLNENSVLILADFEEDLNKNQHIASGVYDSAPSKSGIVHEYNEESHSGRYREFGNPNLHECADPYHDARTSNNDEGVREFNLKESSEKKSRSNYSTLQESSPQNNREKDLRDMNRELDKMNSKLNKYQKSLEKSEKHLVKMENKMEYLESFALGEESEWL